MGPNRSRRYRLHPFSETDSLDTLAASHRTGRWPNKWTKQTSQLLMEFGLNCRRATSEEAGMDWHAPRRAAVYILATINLGTPLAVRAQQKSPADLVKECMQMNRQLTIRNAGRGDILKDFCSGLFYETGDEGVPKNMSAAMRYYRLSADAGFAPGQLTVGSLYQGHGRLRAGKSLVLKGRRTKLWRGAVVNRKIIFQRFGSYKEPRRSDKVVSFGSNEWEPWC